MAVSASFAKSDICAGSVWGHAIVAPLKLPLQKTIIGR
jgi:hypothetical protein